jgi:hypothetical protein
MQKIGHGKVYVLVTIVENGYGIVAVFARHELAVQYADENQTRGWHVMERDFYAPKQ